MQNKRWPLVLHLTQCPSPFSFPIPVTLRKRELLMSEMAISIFQITGNFYPIFQFLWTKVLINSISLEYHQILTKPVSIWISLRTKQLWLFKTTGLYFIFMSIIIFRTKGSGAIAFGHRKYIFLTIFLLSLQKFSKWIQRSGQWVTIRPVLRSWAYCEQMRCKLPCPTHHADNKPQPCIWAPNKWCWPWSAARPSWTCCQSAHPIRHISNTPEQAKSAEWDLSPTNISHRHEV